MKDSSKNIDELLSTTKEFLNSDTATVARMNKELKEEHV